MYVQKVIIQAPAKLLDPNLEKAVNFESDVRFDTSNEPGYDWDSITDFMISP